MKTVAIFGGSGFVGKNLVHKLIKNGFRVKIITRDKERASFFKTYASVDFISIYEWNYQDFDQLHEILKGSQIVVNLVGILAEKKKGDFIKYHAKFPEELAKTCQRLNIESLVHLSALASENATKSKYAQSKLKGEKFVLNNFSQATILRPSIIFGPQDNFFNKFAKMLRFSSSLPLINKGKTMFQPIYVEDVTDIIIKAISNKIHQGKTYEIGGDKKYSFKQLLEYVGSYCGKEEVRFSNLNFHQAKSVAGFLELFTKNILTRDQVELLKTDNVLSNNEFKEAFKINPRAVEEIVPDYIG